MTYSFYKSQLEFKRMKISNSVFEKTSVTLTSFMALSHFMFLKIQKFSLPSENESAIIYLVLRAQTMSSAFTIAPLKC